MFVNNTDFDSLMLHYGIHIICDIYDPLLTMTILLVRVEKYRPSQLDELVSHGDIISTSKYSLVITNKCY
jgi:hypothetical protein